MPRVESKDGTPTGFPDHSAESDMAKFGISQRDWRVMEISLADIDMADSWQNHARLNGFRDEETINRYAEAYRRGDKLPWIIVYEKPNGRYYILGGNHRATGAKKAGLKTIGAYVIKTDDSYVLDQLPRVLNLTNGLPLRKGEDIRHAVDCVMEHARPIKDVALLYHLSDKTLAQKVSIRRLDSRLSNMGFKPELVHEGVRSRLASLSNDNELKAAFVLARDTEMQAETLNAEIIQPLKKIRPATEEARLAFLERETDRRKASVPTGPTANTDARIKRLPVHSLKGLLTQLENLIAVRDTIGKYGVTKHDEVIELSDRCIEIGKSLRRMGEAGKKSVTRGPRGRSAS